MALKEYHMWTLDNVTPSMGNLSAILGAIIRCRGRLHETRSPDLGEKGEWIKPIQQCRVSFRISLPVAEHVQFMKSTGMTIERTYKGERWVEDASKIP